MFILTILFVFLIHDVRNDNFLDHFNDAVQLQNIPTQTMGFEKKQ